VAGNVIEDVTEVVRGAGRAIEALRGTDLDVRTKGEQGPSTAADREADALLKRELLALEPCGWLSEETADDPCRVALGRTWIVDPLDGTIEYLAGFPEYAVSVALVDRGKPVLAVVHQPLTGATWWAELRRGAVRDGRPIGVTESDILLASRTEVERGEFAAFASRWHIRPQGSIALKLALVAGGAAGVTFSQGNKWEWDICAGALLVTEAGGRATDIRGRALRFNGVPPLVAGILAGAPKAWARARRQVAQQRTPR
jgi:myo-inositol-1(or 4)-monophosphatase